MVKMPSISTILAQILDQHHDLRDRMDRCEQLADELDAGHGAASVLVREVGELRVAFSEHSRFEERHLRPIFNSDYRVAQHVVEHQTMHAQLTTSVTSELRSTLGHMRGHLDAEDLYFDLARVADRKS